MRVASGLNEESNQLRNILRNADRIGMSGEARMEARRMIAQNNRRVRTALGALRNRGRDYAATNYDLRNALGTAK